MMKNLFDGEAYNEIIARLNMLTPQTQQLWGKMGVAQMMAHCTKAVRVSITDKKIPRMFIGYLFGWLAKKKVTSEKPYTQGLPTAPDFVIKDKRDFEKEKALLTSVLNEFYTRGPENAGKFPHPFFGRLTKEEWGESNYKHLDHHLRQFGV